MVSKVKTGAIEGIDGYIVEVETFVSGGLPGFDIVGLGDTSVKESKERVRAAVRTSGYKLPTRKIIMNLAPAYTKKSGTSYDLPIALGLLASFGHINIENLNEYLFLGELSLDGRLRWIQGVLPITISAKNSNIKKVIVPCENAKEAAIVDGVEVYGASSLKEVIEHVNDINKLEETSVNIEEIFAQNEIDFNNIDFSEVRGQQSTKRALEVAASGGHNCLMIGSPGCGKTMLAKRLPTILPPLSFEEALETTKIYSIAGLLKEGQSIIINRPFRNPHHTASTVSMIGGGRIPKPGEISLAHNGVIFLDELPEFNKNTLEVLRQPLEDGNVTISRVNAVLTYPCNSTLIAAANPCRCGYLLDDEKECTCSASQVSSYLGKLSGPLLDRIDLQIEVKSVKLKDIGSEQKGEDSKSIRKRVINARKIQQERYKDASIFTNSQLTPKLQQQYCKLEPSVKQLLLLACDKLGLSARAYTRILKVARTIADMEQSENITRSHISEAINYRSLDRKL